jgi:ketosteroid isomerase-like protein
MSQENVEVVRRAFAAVQEGDFEGYMSALDPEIEWDGRRAVPDTTVAHGHDAVRSACRRWFGAWEDDFEVQAEEIVELAPDIVLVVVHDVGTAKGTGITIDRRNFQLWEFRDGVTVRLRAFLDRDEALEAVGLRE